MSRPGSGTAEIRCYGDLNDLLPVGRRQTTLVFRFDVAPTLKDAIEAYGVPHVEVFLVTRNGEIAALRDRLESGDRVAAYPRFRTLVLRPTSDPKSDVPLGFVADVHLRKLARWLRLLGFDVLYDPAADHSQLISLCAKTDRILLSRDRTLLRHGALMRGAFIRSTDPSAQTLQVLRQFDLFSKARPFARCPICGGVLSPVEKSEVAERIPPRTAAWLDEYTRCDGCGKLYWRGTHHARLAERVERLLRPAA